MKKWVKYKENGKEMWCFGEQEDKYCIGLDERVTILVQKDQVIFLDSWKKTLFHLRKLTHEENEMISKKIAELTELHKRTMNMEAEVYQYTWSQFDLYLTRALLRYRDILN